MGSERPTADDDETGSSVPIIAIAVLAAVVVVVVRLFRVSVLGNEPPIRVKNGSIQIDVSAGNNWKENDDDGSWSPDQGAHPDLFSVKVTGQGATAGCLNGLTAAGKMIDVSYSGGGGVLFRATKQVLRKYTRVTGFGGDLVPEGQYLRYDKGGAGYISGIVVRGGGSLWNCTFNQKDASLEIYICSSPDAPACK